MDCIFEKYAKLLIHYSLKLKKGQSLYIRSSHLAEPLLLKIYEEAVRVGAHVDFNISLNGATKIFYDNAAVEQLQRVSPLYRHVIENYDATLAVNAPFNLKELQNVPAEKKKIVSMASTDINKTFMKRSFEGKLKWSLCEFPTDAGAQEAGMSKAEYADFVYSSCFLYDDDPVASWEKVKESQQKWADRLEKSKKIRFLGKDTDITFGVEGRKWINSCGDANMPSGEIFTTPVEDSVNGKIRFSYPGIFMGQEIEDISLEVKGGEVVAWDARKGRELLDSVFEIPGSRRFGEAAIGTNYGIKKFIKNMLFDEKIGGTIHMAIGAAYPHTGGKNESSIHWDLLADMKDGGRIFADEELVYQDGKFII